MKQTKHFKRTAFNLSAKSMVSLMLLLIAMLMPQGAWATDFISEIKIGANSNQNTAKGYLSGYTPIDKDLNYGNSKSWYIYLGYKTDTDASKAITGIMIVSGKDYLGDEYLEGGTKTLSYDGKTWYRSPAQGAADLNKGASGDYLTIFYTRDGNTVNGGKPLVSLSVAEETGLSGYTYAGLYKDGAFSANGSTNAGTTGAARYIIYTTHNHAYTAAFNWADDGKSCTATTNCAGCGDTHSNLACTVTSAPKSGAAATCTVMGRTTYTAKVTSNGKEFSATKDVQDIAALGHGTAGYTDSYSWTGNAYNDASQDTKACTFTLTCKKCSTKVVNGASLTCTMWSHVDATCRATGSTTYRATGSYTAANSAYNYSATKTHEYPIAALGHGSTGYTESYVWTGNAYNDWSQDTKACIFTLTCKNCSTKVVNGASLTCIRTAHVDATCTATGSTTYQATGSYTSSNSAYNYMATKTNVYTVAALGHGSTGYTDSYSWTGNAYNDASQDTKACTFTLTCNKCSTKVVNGASLTCIKTAHVDASCTATGSTTYQATGSYTAANSAYNYMATKTNDYTVAALGHGSTGYTPTYTWGGTYDAATCTFTLQCGSCGGEVFNDNITTSKVQANHVDATCGKAGNERWTATGSYSKTGDAQYNGEAQAKDYAIPATGLHTFADDDLAQGHCTVCNHGFFRYTAEEKVEPRTPENLKDAEGQGIYDKEKHTFDGKNGVMEFDKPLVTIGEKAFFGRYQFEGDLIIPNTVTTIENYGFNGCEGYTGNLIIPSSVTTIGEYAFCFCNFTGNLTIPNNINLGKSAFANCKGFNGTLTVSTPNIGERAFGDCSGFTELILSNSVETIGKNAFQGCSSFSGNLNIPGSVTSIGYGAFSDCSGFTGDLTIPNSVTSVASIAFRGCSGFNGNLTIPNDIDKIEFAVFKGCSGLTGTLTIPSSVKEIGNSAFDGCAGLTGNLTIPSSVTSIEWEAFRGCSGFTGIEMNSVPQIGTDAFNSVNCTKAVVLSDNSYVYTGENPYFPTVASVTYNRYIINDGGMWSFIVPFDIPAAQAAELGKFYQYSKHEEDKVYFDDITKIDNADGIVRANTAYFFEPAKDITSITVENPTFDTTGNMPDATNPSEPGLYGTYSQIEIPVGAYGYAMHDGQSTFVKAGTGNVLRSFRAYLWLGSGASMARALAFFGEEEANGIFDIDAESEHDIPAYDLSGQRVNDGYKGIVIKNGKKIMVK